MFSMAGTISNNYSLTSPTTKANTRLSGILNLTGGIVALGSVVPGFGQIFGVVGGALRVGAAAVALSSNGSDIPSPAVAFDDSLSNIAQQYTTYAGNLTAGFDKAVDNIQSDSGKLSTIGALTSDTDSAWNFPSQISADQLQGPLVDGAARSLWLDIVPQQFGIRYISGGYSSNAGDYGGYGYHGCVATYPKVNAAVYGSYLTIPNPYPSQGPSWDVYVFADNPTPTSNDQAVSVTLAEQLTTAGVSSNGSNNLNLPAMLLYGYSNMNYSVMPLPPDTGEGTAGYCPP